MTSAATYPAHPVYPARVEAHLDQSLSRWLWLVRRVLVIPHVVVGEHEPGEPGSGGA